VRTDSSEHIVLITGATDGLGRAVASELASAGATVLLHGRDPECGRQSVEDIRTQTGNEKLGWYEVDFSSLDEVLTMAEQLVGEQQCLDVLVNDAGIGTTVCAS
jgi:NAD(P)-dependent dehydrogenase (short-subunit alcohol dehydrogenase family)